MPHPVVSVIIPTYNRTYYLKLTIESVINQTFQDFEIIVVDDGTQNEYNKMLCETFEKVNYIKIPNSGSPARPRNIGIKESKGKYIAFVDDDDLWLPNKLEKQVEIFEKNKEFGLIHGCCEVIDENGVSKNKIIGRPGSLKVKHGDVSLRMMGNWTVMMPTSIIRKDVIEKVGFFNEIMHAAGEDNEFWVRASFETKFYYIDEPLVKYRIHKNNISNENKKYIELPMYLKKVLDSNLAKDKISLDSYKNLQIALCQLQIRTVKMNFFYSIIKLFQLDNFWFVRKNNFKMLLYTLFFKRVS